VRDFDLTQETAAERVGKSRAAVANSLRLLSLDAEIQGFIAKSLLSVGHAKALLAMEDPARRTVLARRVIEEGLSVRLTERLGQAGKAARRVHRGRRPAGVPWRRATPRRWRASRRGSPPTSARAWP
jgi:ParB-like chromosome segregation protein Spo0J